MADGTFKLAIIGAGGISGAHSGAVTASGGKIVLTAAVDTNGDAVHKLASSHPGCRTFTGTEEFLDAMDLGKVEADGVVVCTPPSMRIPIVQACLKAGLDVLSEKPLAHTASDAKKLAAIAAKHPKRRAFVASCHRFAPAVLKMKQLVNEGKVGQLVRFENFFACDLPGHKGKWFSDAKKSGGGAYLDMGSHSIDLFHFVAGASRTAGAVFSHKWKGRTETAATVLVESTKAPAGTKNIRPGVAGSIISGWAETCRFTVALAGDAGMLFYDYEKPTELVFKDLGGKAELIPVETHDVRFARQLQAFADASSRGSKKTGLASFADGVDAAMAFDAAVKLAK